MLEAADRPAAAGPGRRKRAPGTRRLLRRRRRAALRDGTIKPHRAFDPRRVGGLECDAWVAYYRRQWASFLRANEPAVGGGCDLESPLIDEERAALVRSYAGLLAAVHRP